MAIETKKETSEKLPPMPMGWTNKEYKQYEDLLIKANVGQLQYIHKALAKVIEVRLTQKKLMEAYN